MVIVEFVVEFNVWVMCVYGVSCVEFFVVVDVLVLKLLLVEFYVFVEWKICWVVFDYYVEIDGFWYFVFYWLICE